ncbi:hypothetical protein EON67_06520 [archaeon]|nr:MAG: hypothetical protein EON67_06520 [archaeon]
MFVCVHTLNEHDSVQIFFAGHGGDGFLKFHDRWELSSMDLAIALREAKAAGRFKEALVIFETCQASTLVEPIDVPGVVSISSSVRAQNSFSRGFDTTLLSSLSDEFSFQLARYLTNIAKSLDAPHLEAATRAVFGSSGADAGERAASMLELCDHLRGVRAGSQVPQPWAGNTSVAAPDSGAGGTTLEAEAALAARCARLRTTFDAWASNVALAASAGPTDATLADVVDFLRTAGVLSTVTAHTDTLPVERLAGIARAPVPPPSQGAARMVQEQAVHDALLATLRAQHGDAALSTLLARSVHVSPFVTHYRRASSVELL